jgi:hypothetical protein
MKHANLCWSVIALLSALSGCSGAQMQEVGRIPSPDMRFEAVITEGIVGATAPTPYEVHLVNAGKEPAVDDLVLRIDKSQRPNVRWMDGSSAVLECDQARVWQFRNFASIPLQDGDYANISLVLSCGERGWGSSK